MKKLAVTALLDRCSARVGLQHFQKWPTCPIEGMTVLQ